MYHCMTHVSRCDTLRCFSNPLLLCIASEMEIRYLLQSNHLFHPFRFQYGLLRRGSGAFSRAPIAPSTGFDGTPAFCGVRALGIAQSGLSQIACGVHVRVEFLAASAAVKHILFGSVFRHDTSTAARQDPAHPPALNLRHEHVLKAILKPLWSSLGVRSKWGSDYLIACMFTGHSETNKFHLSLENDWVTWLNGPTGFILPCAFQKLRLP